MNLLNRRHSPPGARRLVSVLICYAIVTNVASPSLAQQRKTTTYAGYPLRPGEMQFAIPKGKRVIPPKFLRGDAPKYPITQAWLRNGGQAVISFVIDENGRTGNFKVVRTDYPYFASHAIVAMKTWRFEPARRDGKPVALHAIVPFTYTADARAWLRR